MTAYLLKDDRREFASHDVYDAWDGFQELGEEVRPFGESSLRHGLLGNTRADVVCGWVRTIRLAWERLGVRAPAPIDYPQPLATWLHRRVWPGTLRDLAALDRPAFVKPAADAKLFDGRVHMPGDAIAVRQPVETSVWMSDVVQWRSEWRAYVRGGSIIGAYPYRGDWRVSPSWSDLDAMVHSWSDSPCAYALDIGVLIDGRTALIEANDAWALGNYGLLPADYAGLLRMRWDEIVVAS